MKPRKKNDTVIFVSLAQIRLKNVFKQYKKLCSLVNTAKGLCCKSLWIKRSAKCIHLYARIQILIKKKKKFIKWHPR